MKDYVKAEQRYFINVYSRYNIVVSHGNGVYLYDANGKAYLDFFSGIAVNALGYGNARILKAVKEQAEKIMHASNLFYIPPQIELAEKLYELSNGYKVFFSNSGAEANEAAIKLAKRFTKKDKILAAYNSFHGRTIATLSITGQEKYKKNFGELLRNVEFFEYNNEEDLKNKFTKDVACLFIEPVQGEGGVIPARKSFMKACEELCKEYNALLIIDEIQTGLARCGEIFAFKLFDVEPGIFTLAKSLGAGLPLGATLAKQEIAEAFGKGDHGSTFGGNPVACAASLEFLKLIQEENLAENARKMGDYLKSRLKKLKEKHSIIKEVRGLGLMLGIELRESCKNIVEKALEKGLILNCTQEKVIRLLPPLVIKKEHADKAIEILDACFEEVSNAWRDSKG